MIHGPRVLHVIAEYSAHEAMGRTVRETALRVPGEHHLVAARVHDGADVFAGVHELGGSVGTFPWPVRSELAHLLDTLRPDVVHLHAGALGPLMAWATPLRHQPLVLTMYAWPTLPRRHEWSYASVAEMRASNVLQPRVAVTTALPAWMLRAALRRTGAVGVLTPDPRVRERLGQVPGVPVVALPSGAPRDPRRAQWDDEHPVVLFAGRAETVRGIDTLLTAFPQVLAVVPGARLRLLLIPRPELDGLLATAREAGIGDALEVVTEPVPDILAEMAQAQVGTWPFKFDYTTSPPAMAVAEALSVGLPVVSTPVACVRAVVTADENGLLVPVGDASALASALVRLLTDRSSWDRLAAAGPRTTERFGWDAAAVLTDRMYDRVPARALV